MRKLKMDQNDTTKKIEQTETGFKLTVKSCRGTGTRDQNTVEFEARTEEMPSDELQKSLTSAVNARMDEVRAHQPDEDQE